MLATFAVSELSYRYIERGLSDAWRRNALASINRLRAASDRRAAVVKPSE